MAWATPDDVKAYTDVTVNAKTITRAQAVIDLATNRTEAASGAISARDRHWLRMATAYQAAWMDAHPETFATMDVASLSQEGLSVTHRTERDTLYLAPLARKALSRLSWRRTRSLTTKSIFSKPPGSLVAERWKSL